MKLSSKRRSTNSALEWGRFAVIIGGILFPMLPPVPPCIAALWNPMGSEAHGTATEQFEYALTLEKAGRHGPAMAAYQKVVDDFPSSPLAAEAQFRVGEMLEKTRHFFEAFNAYQAVLDNFPSYPKVNLILERQLRIGNLFLQGKTVSFLKLSSKGSCKRAITIFRKILSNAPFSDVAPQAQYNLGMAHLKRKEYVEAAIEFEKIPMRYPHSGYVASAKYRLGVCAYRQAKAAPYDQEAAQEAINRLREYIEEYPDDKNAEVAKEMLIELQSRRAGALYSIGRFYEERDNPKASLIYYREVIREYPLTRYAERARRRARREESKLELAQAVRKAREDVSDILRKIGGQKESIKRITGKGRSHWKVWSYVIPRKLSDEEKREIKERNEKISALRERLDLARLDLREKNELMRNRFRYLRAESEAERIEDEIREAQVELQVAQNKLSEIGDLPEEESSILEEAAADIAAKEELVRRRERELEKARLALAALEDEVRENEGRIKERYRKRREALKGGMEEGTGREQAEISTPVTGPLGEIAYRISAGPSRAVRALSRLVSGVGHGMRRVFGARGGRRGETVENSEEVYAEAVELLERADRNSRARKWSDALRCYDRASLRLFGLKKAWPGYRPREVDDLLRRCSEGLKRARGESAKRQYEEISAEIEKRLEKNSDDADAHFSLAFASQRYGDVGRAIDEYRKVISLRPRDAGAYHNLGIAYKSRGEMQKAAATLRKAVELEPLDEIIHHNLGVVYKGLGDYEAARKSFTRALAVNPSFAPSYLALGRLFYSALGDRRAAARCWKAYLTLKPESPLAGRLREWIKQVEGEGSGKPRLRYARPGTESTSGPAPGEARDGGRGTGIKRWWRFWKKGSSGPGTGESEGAGVREGG